LASDRSVMAEFTLHPILRMLGWLATAVMTAAAVAMLASLATCMIGAQRRRLCPSTPLKAEPLKSIT
jgi:hypothetical protein